MKKLFLLIMVGLECLAAGNWKFEVRAVGGLNMQCDISGASYSALAGIHSLYPTGGTVGSSIPQDSGGFADREFLDGYVKKDPGTGDPSSLAPDCTWFWGYENASQFNSSTGMLSFHTPVFQQQSEHFSGNILTNRNCRHSEDFHAAGLEFSLSGDWLQKAPWTLRWTAGLAVFDENDISCKDRVFQEQGIRTAGLQRQQAIYTYDTQGMTLPAPGYHGTFDGPFATPPPAVSPLLPNRPNDISIENLDSQSGVSQNYSLTTVDTEYDISARLSEINLGGKLFYDLNAALQVYFSLHLLCAIVECEGDYHEQFLQTESSSGNILSRKIWKSSSDTARLLLGMSCGAGLEYRLTEQLSLGAGILRKQYFDKIRTGLGPGEVKLDFSCMAFDLYFGWRF